MYTLTVIMHYGVNMHWFPEKVESKLFLMVMTICLGASLFSAQLLLSTEEDSLLEKTKSDLEGLSQQHEFSLLNELKDRMYQGVQVAKTIQKAWSAESASTFPLNLSEQSDGSKIGVSPNLVSSVYISSGTQVSKKLMTRIALAEQAFEGLAPEYLSYFRNITFITTENVCISSPASQSALIPDGTIISNHPILVDIPTRKRSGAKPYWTPVRLDANLNIWLTTLVVPMFDGDTYVGVLISEYSLNQIFSRITPTRTNEAPGKTFIIRGDDELILHANLRYQIEKNFKQNNQGISIQHVPNSDAKAIMDTYDAATSKKPFTYMYNGAPHVAYVKPIDHNGWTLVVYMGSEHINATIASFRWKLTAGSLVIAFILMFLIRDAFHRLFLKRILELEQATHDYVTNEEFIIPNPGKDEIGQLAYSFQELIHSLEAGKSRITQQALQLESETVERLQVIESLEESETKFRALFEESSDAIMLLGEEHCIDCNNATLSLFHFNDKSMFLETPLLDLSPLQQPYGQQSKEAWKHHTQRAFENGKDHFEWQIQTHENECVWVDILLTVIPYQGDKVLHAVMRNIGDRKNEEMERVRLTTAIEQAAESIMLTGTSGNILYVNPAFEDFNQYTREDVLGKNTSLLFGAKHDSNFINDIHRMVMQGQVWKGQIECKRKDNTEYMSEFTISPVRDNEQNIINFVYVSRDVSKEISMELQLRQAQKMEAIGELASGIAHEINTPTQYIGDNIRFFRDSFEDLRTLLDEYKKINSLNGDNGSLEELRESVQKITEDIDLEYLEEEIPLAIAQSLDGNARVAEIIRAMKEFAHPGAEERIAIDINHAIKNTISVARNEWKYVADIETNLAADLPLLTCYPGSLNQVLLNMVVNASHAIADTIEEGGTDKGLITLTTSHDDTWLEIRIKDTGSGIKEENRSKIFDPFFTTKEIGKGTGQGLSIAHSVIVEKHQGIIDVESEVGKGTTFILKIPLETETV